MILEEPPPIRERVRLGYIVKEHPKRAAKIRSKSLFKFKHSEIGYYAMKISRPENLPKGGKLEQDMVL